MGNSKSSYKNKFLYCNLLIFALLIGVYCYLTRDVKEGIRNMGCCGGIEAGVHYSETDTKPPRYVRKCFKSSDDWSGFPCTGKDSPNCCEDGKGGYGKGECIPTKRGGYCKADTDFIFRKGESKPYLKRGGDDILDINDANDMKDYFYDRGEKKARSPEMQRFLARRDRNEKYIEQHLREKRKLDSSEVESSKAKIKEQNQKIEIISTVTILHLLFLVVFSIVIREEIIQKIDMFYNLLYTKYLSFSGKSV